MNATLSARRLPFIPLYFPWNYSVHDIHSSELAGTSLLQTRKALTLLLRRPPCSFVFPAFTFNHLTRLLSNLQSTNVCHSSLVYSCHSDDIIYILQLPGQPASRLLHHHTDHNGKQQRIQCSTYTKPFCSPTFTSKRLLPPA